MRTKYFIIITTTLALLLLASCEKEIEFKGEISKPLLVVNGFITPDSVIKVQVSKSQFFLSKQKNTFPKVTDAKVSLYINNSLLETIPHSEKGMYVSSIKPIAGDHVRIVVEKNGETTVQAETIVPKTVYILKVDTLNVKIINDRSTASFDGQTTYYETGYQHFETNMLVRFSDPMNERNFYRLTLHISNFYDDRIEREWGYFTSDDIVYGGASASPIDGGNRNTIYFEFSDDIFNGKEYGLKLTTNRFEYKKSENDKKSGYKDVYEPEMPHRIEYSLRLHSISRDYFFYLRSLTANSNNIAFFSEPVQIHSNVENGIGIFGSYSIHEHKVVYIPQK